jgi:hypothetical protein
VKDVGRLWYLQTHQPQAFSSCRQSVASGQSHEFPAITGYASFIA